MKRILMLTLIISTIALPALALEITRNETEHIYLNGIYLFSVVHDPEVTNQEHPDDPISVSISVTNSWYLYVGEGYADSITTYHWSDSENRSGGYVMLWRLYSNGVADVFSYTSWGDSIWWD